MAHAFHSPLPFIDFKAFNRFEPDDFGRKCRVTEIAPERHVVSIKSKNGYVSIGQAPFKSAAKAIEWTNMRYSLDGEIGV